MDGAPFVGSQLGLSLCDVGRQFCSRSRSTDRDDRRTFANLRRREDESTNARHFLNAPFTPRQSPALGNEPTQFGCQGRFVHRGTHARWKETGIFEKSKKKPLIIGGRDISDPWCLLGLDHPAVFCLPPSSGVVCVSFSKGLHVRANLRRLERGD